MQFALTGCASGIGASVAAKLKKRGAPITAFDLNEPTGNIDNWIKVDFSNADSIAAAANEADGMFDALINNAGLPPREGLAEMVLKVNYIGLRQFTGAMLDKLSPGSAIVNTASRAGSMWRDNIDELKALMALRSGDEVGAFIAEHNINHIRAYNLSKEAVIVSTYADTEKLKERNLRVNSVSPAAVSTGILEDFKIAFGERAANSIARAGRPGEPDEIADAIVFLASPESRWIKGQDILIDGGMSAMAMSDALGLVSGID